MKKPAYVLVATIVVVAVLITILQSVGYFDPKPSIQSDNSIELNFLDNSTITHDQYKLLVDANDERVKVDHDLLKDCYDYGGQWLNWDSDFGLVNDCVYMKQQNDDSEIICWQGLPYKTYRLIMELPSFETKDHILELDGWQLPQYAYRGCIENEDKVILQNEEILKNQEYLIELLEDIYDQES